jgi:56kDa selenium binding protein (SBP56)
VSDEHQHHHTGPGYASPQVAKEQPPEQFIYVAGLFEGTGIERPDFIAVVDVANEPLEEWPLPGGVPGLITDLVLLGRDGGHPRADAPLSGGPQMLQCSLDGGARPHEIHLPGGDCTTEIFQQEHPARGRRIPDFATAPRSGCSPAPP